LNFLDGFSKNTEISNFTKIRPVGADFHADGQTDMKKLTVDFAIFANAPKSGVPEDSYAACLAAL